MSKTPPSLNNPTSSPWPPSPRGRRGNDTALLLLSHEERRLGGEVGPGKNGGL